MSARRKALPFVPALAVAAAFVAGAAQAEQRSPRSVPLCTLEERLPLDSRLLNRIRDRADYEDLLRYASDNCAELALFLADTATATIPASEAETDGGREGPQLLGFLRAAEAPVAEAQPGTDPVGQLPGESEPEPAPATQDGQMGGTEGGNEEDSQTGGPQQGDQTGDALQDGGTQDDSETGGEDPQTGGSEESTETCGPEGGTQTVGTENDGQTGGPETGGTETGTGQTRVKNNNGFGNGGEGDEGETETGNPSGRTGPNRA